MDKVLLVDDDMHTLNILEATLGPMGYELFRAETAAKALETARATALDCIVLDVDLPDGSGVEVCGRIREITKVPIIFLSAFNKDDDRIRGLLAGGDDYMGKPYNPTELALRIRVRIDRYRGRETGDVLRMGGLEIDLGVRQIRYNGQPADFSPLEFDLLAFLAQHPGQVFSYEQLYDRVWREPINKGLHNLQVRMARVRMKLEALCPGHVYIETIRRKGYRFNYQYQEESAT